MADQRGSLSLRVSQQVATVLRIDPFEGPEMSWTPEAIEEYLVGEAVTYGILKDKLIELSEAVNNTGKPVFNMVIASGLLPQEESTEPLIPSGSFVLPGEPIAVYKKSQMGMTVFGEELAPADATATEAGVSVSLDEATGQMMSMAYGRVAIKRGRIQVEQAISVSSDMLKATADLVSQTAGGREVSLKDIEQALADLSISEGILLDEISRGLVMAGEKGGGAISIVVARGVPAIDGKDGRIELLRDMTSRVGKKDASTGKIDFRERDTVHIIGQGEVICRLIPPVGSVSGVDIYGESLYGRDGLEPRAPRMENVSFDEETLEFRADCPGGLIYNAEVVAVTSVFVVQGDVDFETGSLHARMASVHVTGDVLDLFEITTEGSVTIDGHVGDATIICGQHLVIHGGLVMKEHGRIEAAGSVSARFMQNANVVAGGDIVIGDSAVQCRLEAGGQILAWEGKGKIIGGIHKARGGLVANQFGSEVEVPTELIVAQPEVFERLKDVGNRFRNDLEEIKNLLGDQKLTESKLAAMPARKEKAFKAVMTYSDLAQHNLGCLVQLRDPLLADPSSAPAEVSVMVVMHPGTRVTIQGVLLEIKKPVLASRISYARSQEMLELNALGSAKKAEVERGPNNPTLVEDTLVRLASMMAEGDRLNLLGTLRTVRDLSSATQRILVADDQRSTRAILSRMLQKYGYTVFEDTGARVIHEILKHSVDLVLLDIAFPGGKNGIEILKEIKAHELLKDLPVIMITAHKSKPIIRAALTNKADGLLLKPFSMDLVRENVERCLVEAVEVVDSPASP